MDYNIVVSRNQFNIIGINNKLVVSCKDDLQNFKRITSDEYPEGPTNIVVMGYNTWLSMNQKPLPRRMNVIISNNHKVNVSENVHQCESLDKMFEWVSENCKGRLFIIGGSYLFRECNEKYSHLLNNVYMTEFYNYHKLSPKAIVFPVDILSNLHIETTSDIYQSDCKVYNEETDLYETSMVKYKYIHYKNISYKNVDEKGYLDVMKDIIKNGTKVSGRNGTVISQFGVKMVFSLHNNVFPLLTTKKMPLKTILRELLWFIKGSTNNEELQNKNVHIWDQNASKEFIESRGLSYGEGDLGPIYGFQWRHFGSDYQDCHTDYTGKGIDQLQYVIDEITNNPSSRRILMSAWNPVDIEKMALPPCHVMVQFFVNQEKNELDAQMYQRSGDMFLGVPFNIASYSLLIYIIANRTGYKPGRLIHIIGDAHIYEEHLEAVTKQISRDPVLFPTLDINPFIEDIDEIREDQFNINQYRSYSRLSAPMIA